MKKETPRVWHKGPPPHVGWWNASNARWTGQWRWWDGVQWSDWAGAGYTAEDARAAVLRLDYDGGIEWTNYWPEGARVPRVDPANRWIAPMLPALNAGSMFAWEEAAARMRVREQYEPAVRAQQARMKAAFTRPDPAPTPEEDEAWSAFSTGHAQTPGARELAGVNTLALMKELFRRFQE